MGTVHGHKVVTMTFVTPKTDAGMQFTQRGQQNQETTQKLLGKIAQEKILT